MECVRRRIFAALIGMCICCVWSVLEAADTPGAPGTSTRTGPAVAPPLLLPDVPDAPPVRTAAPAAVSPATPVLLSADFAYDWEPAGLPGRVYLLRGQCRITQGTHTVAADQAVVWIARLEGAPELDAVRIALEGDVEIELPNRTDHKSEYYTRWKTSVPFETEFRRRSTVNCEQDAVYQRAWRRRLQAEPLRTLALAEAPGPMADESGPQIEPIAFTEVATPIATGTPSVSDASLPTPITFAERAETRTNRRLRLFSRSATPFNLYSFEDPRTTPAEQVLVITGGVNLVIDGLEGMGTVDLRADHMVLWTQAVGDFDPQAAATFIQQHDAALQVYLEGNVIVLQERGAGGVDQPLLAGTTRTRAQRAFFDVRENRAILQQVELKFDTPGLPLSVRIRAEEVRQVSKSTFQAHDAWVTTSKFGKPGYKVAAKEVLYEERPTKTGILQAGHTETAENGPSAVGPDGIGVPALEGETTPWVTTVNPTFQVEDVPIFWWPKLSAPAQFSGTPLKQITVENDRVFGGQLRTSWDPFQLFGRDAPAGTNVELLADALSLRGVALGANGNWKRETEFGQGKGQLQLYGLHDDGTDRLGADRLDLAPEEDWRGRATIRHQQQISDNLTFFGEFSSISDRNFLEQFFESEWDTGKDQETLLGLKAQNGQYAGTIMGRVRLNDFDTTSDWLPKADAYVLGKSLWDGRANWSSHSSIGYGRLRPAEAPLDPTDIFTPLSFVADREGLVAMSRHEITAPLMLGPMKIVPYALGEVAYWGDDLTGNDMFRAYGSAGVRGSLLFTRAMPNVENQMLGLRGLVHKMTLDFDYSYSDASERLSDVAQYNEIDEQSQYRFRNRLVQNTFGGMLPAQFDPRLYAVRSGAGRSVTSPYFELVDTQDVLRLGWRHRLQTQDGPFDNPHWRDWMTLDLEASLFPHATRDNFGETMGLLNANYAWNFSERTSFVASGSYDLFDDAQQLWSAGIVSQRGERGSVYVGVRQVKGAGLDSRIVTASGSYELSEKWISSMGTAWDLEENRNLGQSLTLTRVGADWLFHVGGNYDASKNNVGVQAMIETRFGAYRSRNAATNSPRLGNLGPQ